MEPTTAADWMAVADERLADSDLEDIPLWPESLARQPSLETIKFPSHDVAIASFYPNSQFETGTKNLG